MKRYKVSFDAREGNHSVALSATVEAESAEMAVILAETNLKKPILTSLTILSTLKI